MAMVGVDSGSISGCI